MLRRMIRIRLDATDLAHTRFAFSPLWEVVASYRALLNPSMTAVHLPWAREVLGVLRASPIAPMAALITPRLYMPDFLTPPPSTPYPRIEDELATVRATTHEIVRAEVRRTYAPIGELTRDARLFIDDTDNALVALVTSLELYWRKAIAPYWPRMKALLEDDVAERARTLALSGAEALFSDLSPDIHYDGDTLTLIKRSATFHDEVTPGGRGVLLVPSVFVWPKVMSVIDPPWQTTIFYPPRGVGNLWHNAPPKPAKALATLLGETRARIFASLNAPASTQDLARLHRMPPGGVAHHLKQLAQAGMVDKRRDGRIVRYRWSDTGRRFAQLFS
jgi:hypothetical protein